MSEMTFAQQKVFERNSHAEIGQAVLQLPLF